MAVPQQLSNLRGPTGSLQGHTVHSPTSTRCPRVFNKPKLLSSNTSLGSWKVWGPSSSYSDGDAEYYQLTSRLQQQYDLFKPEPAEDAQLEVVEPSTGSLSPEKRLAQRTRPEFGLSPKQIAALGLSGPRVSTPDPVSTCMPQ